MIDFDAETARKRAQAYRAAQDTLNQGAAKLRVNRVIAESVDDGASSCQLEVGDLGIVIDREEKLRAPEWANELLGALKSAGYGVTLKAPSGRVGLSTFLYIRWG